MSPTRSTRSRRLRASVSAALAAVLVATAPLPAAHAEDEVLGAAAVVRAAEQAAAPNTVSAFGAAVSAGPSTPLAVARPLVGMAAHPGGRGYWLVAADGGVFTFGDAPFAGSAGGIALNQPIVGMAATPSGRGYWLVAADGGIFAYGDARFHGSAGAIRLNQPVVGMAATPTGDGYWLVARDGGVFSYGDAAFHGSTGAIRLNQPVVGMAATPTGGGYWFVAADGGVFSYGDAAFAGSTGGQPLPAAVVGMAADPGGDGYWLAGQDGRVHAFGVADHGSAVSGTGSSGARTLGIAASPGGGGGYWLVHGEQATFGPEDAGPAVAAVQRRLTDLGYWLGPVDGRYGPLTTQAVYAFQKLEGLPVTGRIDGDTRRALDRAARPTPRGSSGIEIDKGRQVLLVVRDGRVVWAFNTSTGTEQPYTYDGRRYLADTPPGRWTITRQIDGVRTGNLGRLYRPKYFHVDGIAVHGSSFIPPYPDSHGCARLSNAAMDLLWSADLAPIGSSVWVYGTAPSV